MQRKRQSRHGARTVLTAGNSRSLRRERVFPQAGTVIVAASVAACRLNESRSQRHMPKRLARRGCEVPSEKADGRESTLEECPNCNDGQLFQSRFPLRLAIRGCSLRSYPRLLRGDRLAVSLVASSWQQSSLPRSNIPASSGNIPASPRQQSCLPRQQSSLLRQHSRALT